MKEYFIKYRPFLQFLAVFLLSYLVLIGIYQFYLSQFDAVTFEVDDFTNLVATQTKMVLDLFGYHVELSAYGFDPSVKVSVDSVGIVRIIEGCNAVSVMILFTAFVLAFSKGLVKTGLFIITGILVIHILNVLRIAFLIIGVLKLPEYSPVLHDVIFPLVIYGVVFLLWILWVTKFSTNATETSST